MPADLATIRAMAERALDGGGVTATEVELARFALAALATLDEWDASRDSEMRDAAHDMSNDIMERLR